MSRFELSWLVSHGMMYGHFVTLSGTARDAKHPMLPLRVSCKTLTGLSQAKAMGDSNGALPEQAWATWAGL